MAVCVVPQYVDAFQHVITAAKVVYLASMVLKSDARLWDVNFSMGFLL